MELPYIKLEVLANEDRDSNCTHLHNSDIIVESFAQNSQLRIGRKADCQIKMGEEYLSRNHSLLTFDKESGCVAIEDAGSIFGTLRYIRGPNLLCFQNQQLRLQFGSTVVDIQAAAIPLKKVKENFFPEVEQIIGEARQHIQEKLSTRTLASSMTFQNTDMWLPGPL